MVSSRVPVHPVDALDILAYLTNHEGDGINAYPGDNETALHTFLCLCQSSDWHSVPQYLKTKPDHSSSGQKHKQTLEFKITLKAYTFHIDSTWLQASQFHPSYNRSSYQQEDIPYPQV